MAMASAPHVKIVLGSSTFRPFCGKRMNKASYQWRVTYLVRSEGQNGIALVAVLGVIVLLSVMAAGLLHDVNTEMQIARNLIDNAKTEALADAGIYRAVMVLQQADIERDDLLALRKEFKRENADQETEDNPETEVGQEVDQLDVEMLTIDVDQHWREDGTVYVWSFGDRKVLLSIQDEGGKIDLNRAPDELIKGLFLSVGMASGNRT